MKKLVLSISDVKRALQKAERFCDIDFAVLDIWTDIEIIQTITDEIKNEELDVKFIDDKSYHRSPPFLALKFEHDKYDISDSFYIRNELEFVKEEFQYIQHAIKKYLSNYSDILLVSHLNSSEKLFLLNAVKNCLSQETQVSALLINPFTFEGDKRFNQAKLFCEKWLDFNIPLHILFLSDFAREHGHVKVNKLFDYTDEMLYETLMDMLQYNAIKCPYVISL
jgi:hypothetical protein